MAGTAISITLQDPGAQPMMLGPGRDGGEQVSAEVKGTKNLVINDTNILMQYFKSKLMVNKISAF